MNYQHSEIDSFNCTYICWKTYFYVTKRHIYLYFIFRAEFRLENIYNWVQPDLRSLIIPFSGFGFDQLICRSRICSFKFQISFAVIMALLLLKSTPYVKDLLNNLILIFCSYIVLSSNSKLKSSSIFKLKDDGRPLGSHFVFV